MRTLALLVFLTLASPAYATWPVDDGEAQEQCHEADPTASCGRDNLSGVVIPLVFLGGAVLWLVYGPGAKRR